jgi:serine/threonine-protein kinase
MRSEIYGAANPETIDTRMYVLLMQEEQNRYAEALPERLRLLELQRPLADSNPKMLANANGMLGVTYIMLGKPMEAERVLRESLAIWAKVQGTNENMQSLRSLANLATALQMQGRYADAEVAQRHALAIAAANTPAASDVVVTERASLGNLLRLQHRHEEALAELRGAAAALENAHGGASTTMKVYARLAEAELDAGNADRAHAPAARAVELGRARLSAGNPRLASPLFALARADLSRGQAAEAEKLLRETLAIRSPPIPGEDVRVLEVKAALVDALARLGKVGEARALRDEVEPLLRSSPLPYAKDLLARLPTSSSIRPSGSVDAAVVAGAPAAR